MHKLLFILLALTAQLTAHADYNSMAVFGDSMTDGGDHPTAVVSYYKLNGDPFPPEGSAPHVPTVGFRFAEDLTWPEYLAQYQGLYTTDTFENWSIGGQQMTDLNPALDDYFARNGEAIADRLYIVALGQVDVLFGDGMPTETAALIQPRLQRMYDNGARQFLVMNSMLARDVPAFKDDTEQQRADATQNTIDFNQQLAQSINALSFAGDVRLFDLGEVIAQLKADGPLHGFTEVVEPCIETAETGEFCENIEGYLFWDVVHFSSQSQRVIADLVDSSILNNDDLSVAITLPKNNARIDEGEALTVSALALDNDARVSRVNFYIDGQLVEIDSTQPYSITWTPDSAGSHSITAQAFNSRGQSVISRITTVQVSSDNQAPTASLNQPVGNSGNVSGAIEAIVADADGSISQVEFYIDGGLFATVDRSPYRLEWNDAPAGSYDVFVKAYDDEGATTDSNMVTVVIDPTLNQAPLVTLAQPEANAGNTIGSIAATPTDPDGTIEKVEFYVGGGLVGTVERAPYTFSWDGVPDGTYEVTAIAYDNNDSATTSNVVEVVVDSTL